MPSASASSSAFPTAMPPSAPPTKARIEIAPAGGTRSVATVKPAAAPTTPPIAAPVPGDSPSSAGTSWRSRSDSWGANSQSLASGSSPRRRRTAVWAVVVSGKTPASVRTVNLPRPPRPGRTLGCGLRPPGKGRRRRNGRGRGRNGHRRLDRQRHQPARLVARHSLAQAGDGTRQLGPAHAGLEQPEPAGWERLGGRADHADAVVTRASDGLVAVDEFLLELLPGPQPGE